MTRLDNQDTFETLVVDDFGRHFRVVFSSVFILAHFQIL